MSREQGGEFEHLRAVIVNRLRGNGGLRGAGELADDVLDAIRQEQTGWCCPVHGEQDDLPTSPPGTCPLAHHRDGMIVRCGAVLTDSRGVSDGR